MEKQKRFKYRNQEYVVEQKPDTARYACDVCEEVNAKYLKGNLSKCVAMTRTGNDKFDCTEKCDNMEYPKRIK